MCAVMCGTSLLWVMYSFLVLFRKINPVVCVLHVVLPSTNIQRFHHTALLSQLCLNTSLLWNVNTGYQLQLQTTCRNLSGVLRKAEKESRGQHLVYVGQCAPSPPSDRSVYGLAVPKCHNH